MDTIQYPTLIKINEMYPQMTQSQQQLATYILENPSIVVNTSITDLMSHTNFRSEASVHSQNDITLDDTPGDIKKKVFLGAINSLNKNSDTIIDECTEAQRLIISANRIIIIGHGASAAICQYAYFRFTELGLNCVYNLDAHMTAALLSHSKTNDLILCVSQSGETADIYKQIENAYRNSRISQFCLIDALFSMISIKDANRMIPRLQETRNTFKKYKIEQNNL